MLAILLIRANAEGAAGMLQGGRLGAEWQQAVISAYGGEVLHQWAVLGRYDAVVVARFDSQEAATAFSLASTAAGQYVELLPGLDVDGFDTAAQLAGAAQWSVAHAVSEAMGSETAESAE
ncbi:MAG: hypothetical protein QOC82_2142 [Frankiaceae bacterium]|jgi:uncharacterized protein with GYD domain|nr:hypothetical protein [Frankiaceae bacterium]